MSRAIVLILLPSYLPGFKAGGPVRSIANLVDSLGAEFDFRILCLDRDLGEAGPYRDMVSDRWMRVGHAMVHYASPALCGPLGLSRLIGTTPHDILYLNSFFSPRFTIAPLVARRLGLVPRRPAIIAPRGEFSAGALML